MPNTWPRLIFTVWAATEMARSFASSQMSGSFQAVSWKDRLGPFGLGIIGYPIGAAIAAVKPPFVRLRIEVDGVDVADFAHPILMAAIGKIKAALEAAKFPTSAIWCWAQLDEQPAKCTRRSSPWPFARTRS
mgnify:CR=1 FL=1